ncbi:hypothetical protein Q8G28_03625 [Lysinibacillus capsici]|uniref:hypothetical protein n=1 Tax=Lysinibacillus TaxID=400634 RepID=UPI0006C9F6FA|nr:MULTISPECIES: hypothetical protein [Lysinibacillus]MDP1392054.1 hypothetical protein [Lysinibacillus capsici]MDP1412530.1 hypothetical protein [Lysinibacillus capsici]MDP1428838.1 hypothetical protein [Lysinibacillus capsici]
MKRDKKNTEFATDEPTKQAFASGVDPKKPNGRKEYTEAPRPQREEDLIMDEKKGKSTSL